MIALALLCALAAFALFGVATEAHHRRWRGGYPTRLGRRGYRGLAWGLIVATMVLAVAARGWIFGSVLAIGLAMLAAGAVFLFLNLVPPPGRAAHKG